MRLLIIGLVVACGTSLWADNVTCNIDPTLTGSCNSQVIPGSSISGQIGVGVNGPGVYMPTPSQIQLQPGPITYVQSYGFQASLTSTGTGPESDSITLTVSIPNGTGEWAAFGNEQGFFPLQNTPGEAAFIVTDSAGLHTGLTMTIEAGQEGDSIVFVAPDATTLDITFTQSSSVPNQGGAIVELLELGAPTPEPAALPLVASGLLAVGGWAWRKRRA